MHKENNYTNADKKAHAMAIRYYDRKLDNNNTNVNYLKYQAALHASTGDTVTANSYYRKVIEQTPQDCMARNDFALHLARQGKYSESMLEMKKAIAVNSTQPTLHKNASAVLSRHGAYPEAWEHARQAVNLNSFDPMNHRNLSKLHDQMGDSSSALHHNLESLRLQHQRGEVPHSKAIRAAAVQTIATGGSHSEAQALMSTARHLEGRRCEVSTTERTYELLGKIQAMKKRDDQADVAAIGLNHGDVILTKEEQLKAAAAQIMRSIKKTAHLSLLS